MFAPQPRYRDNYPRNDDYYADYDRRPRRMSPGPAPRRHKSERRRDYDEPRSRRDDRRYAKSPPSYTTEPRRGHSSREPRDDFGPPRRARTHDESGRGHRSSRRDDRYDEQPRHRSARTSPPPPYDKKRDDGHKSRRSQPDSPPRARGRDVAAYDDGNKSSRRHRSQEQPRSSRKEASPTRGRTEATGTRSGGTSRRKSMPATKGKGIGALGGLMSGAVGGAGGGAGGSQWWQNPMLQAGARTAFAAGAQAAMNSRGKQGDWIGAKGAKVATAALGAALMDGFMGGKREHSPRGGSRERDDGRDRKSGGGGGSGGKGKSGGGFKDKLLSQGLNFVANKAGGRH